MNQVPALRQIDASLEEEDVEHCIETIPDLLRKTIKASMEVPLFMRSGFFAQLAQVLYRKWPDQATAMLREAARFNRQDIEMRTRKDWPTSENGAHTIEKARTVIMEDRDPGRVFGITKSSSMVIDFEGEGGPSMSFDFEASRQRLEAMEPGEALNCLDETVEMIFKDDFGFADAHLIAAVAELYIILGHRKKAKDILDRFLNQKNAVFFYHDYASFLEIYLKLIPEGCEDDLGEIFSKMTIGDHIKLNMKRFIGSLSNIWHY